MYMSKLNDFYQNTLDNILPIGSYVRLLPYDLVFKATHWCWYNCPHCCESAGKNRDKTFIPESVIKYYIDAAKQDPQFTNEVVITGGELMSAYNLMSPEYVPNLVNYILDKKISLDIKTNGAWVNAPLLRGRIFNDLRNLANNHNPLGFQISLSLDKYHPNALENNYEILKNLAQDKYIKIPMLIHISGFDADKHMYQTLITKLKHTPKIKIDEVGVLSTSGSLIKMIRLNKHVCVRYSTVPCPFANGRAKDLPEAVPVELPQFSFIAGTQQNPSVLVAFDAAGNVTLGENSGKKISVPWRDKNGNPRPLPAIKADLVKQTRIENFKLIHHETMKSMKNDFINKMNKIGIKIR